MQLESALDLVTWEIANNLKERKVMVVWMLDASGSLKSARRQTGSRKRLKRIYGELDALERGRPVADARSAAALGRGFLRPERTTLSDQVANRSVPRDREGLRNAVKADQSAAGRTFSRRCAR